MKPAPSTSPDDSALAEILDQVTARLQQGERVNESALLKAHPEYAEQLRELFPALRMLGDLSKSGPDTLNGLMGSKGHPTVGTLGDFRLLREVGRGGMGVVYEAEQITLGRRVALKVLPFGATMDSRQLQRFQNEVRAAASLHHEHIVPVHTVGCERGLHYFAMQFIDGKTLAEMLRGLTVGDPDQQRTTLDVAAHPPGRSDTLHLQSQTRATKHDPHYFRNIAELGVQAAEALEHAHSQGIVHRDVKPANLMIDAQGKLWVTDFGLARIGTNHDLTASGDIIGTLRYMSPEQALAKHNLVDHRTDIYSLGVTLYEMFTLMPAIGGQDRHELLKKIAFEEPLAPRTLMPDLPRELETILLKAIAKDPHLRYQSAEEFAEDLRCFLNDRPIKAKRTTKVQLFLRWRRRNPALATALACLLVVILIGNMLVTWKWRQEREARSDAETAEAKVRERATALQRSAYYQGIARSDLEWWANNVERANQELDRCPEDLRHWEWGFLKGLCHSELRRFVGHEGRVRGLAFSKDGKHLASGGSDRVVRLWDAATGKEVRSLIGHTSNVWSIAFSPDRRYLASAAGDWATQNFGEIIIWDVQTGKAVATHPQTSGMVDSVTYSPDGRTLAYANWDCTIRLLDPATGETRILKGHTGSCKAVVFSPDGKQLVTGAHDTTIRIWDLASGRTTKVLSGHTADVLSLAYSPDGNSFVSVSWDHTARVWNATSGQLLAVLTGHTGAVDGVDYCPDGKQIATSSVDGTVRLWEVGTWKEQSILRIHDRELHALAYSPGGRSLATVGWDGVVKLWDLPHRQYGRPLTTGRNNPKKLLFRPDQEVLAMLLAPAPQNNRPGFIEYIHPRTGDYVRNFSKQTIGYNDFAFSSDSRWLAHDASHLVQICDAQTGAVVRTLEGHACEVVSVAFVPQRPLLVSVARDGMARLWNHETGVLLQEFTTSLDSCTQLAVSPDARHLAFAAKDGRIACWSLHDQQAMGPELTWLAHPGGTHTLAFHPHDGTLASGGHDGSVRLWNATNRQEAKALHGHVGAVHTVCYSPDGKRLVSGGNDGTVVLWDAQHGLEALSLRRQLSGVSSVAFSPDGLSLAALSRESAVGRLWHSDEANAQHQAAREYAWHLAEAKGAEAARQWLAAIEHRSWLVNHEPSQPQHVAQRGLAYAELGRLTEALDDYKQAIETPNAANVRRTLEYVQHRTNYALLLLHQGDETGYLEQCHRLAELYRTSRDVRVLEAIARCFRLYRGDRVDAQPVLAMAERVAFSNPRDAKALALRGMIYFRAGRFADALHSFTKAGQLRGEQRDGDVIDWLWFALAYGEAKYPAQACLKLADAVQWMDRYLEGTQLPPGWTAPPRWQQRLEMKRLRHEAEQLLAVPERNLSREELQTKARREEVHYLSKLIATDGPNIPDLVARGNHYAELGEWKLAAEDYAALVKMPPTSLLMWYRYAASLTGTGDHGAFQKLCNELYTMFGNAQSPGMVSNVLYILTLSPELPCPVDRWLEMGELAKGSFAGNQRILGAVRFRAGEYAGALKAFDQAQPAYTRRAWDWYFVAMTYERLGKHTEAVNALRRAEDWYNDAERTRRDTKATGPRWFSWEERVEVQYLRTQAEQLVQPKKD